MKNHSFIPKHLSNISDIEFTIHQKVFIQNFFTQHRDKLSNWEINFLIVLLNSTHYSEQQKDTLETIIKNFK